MSMKKAILIASPYYPTGDFPPFSPPPDILALGSYLKKNGVPVELIDVKTDFGLGRTDKAELVTYQRIARYLREQADDIAWIGISQVAASKPEGGGLLLGKELHSALPDIPLVFGSYFMTVNYQRLLREYPFISCIVRGDGEVAALAISHALERGDAFPSDNVPNLAWMEGETLRTTPVQPVPLDSLPAVDFNLLRHLRRYPFLNIYTSRGCPFRCNYCVEYDMRPFSMSPPEWVAEQLDCIDAEAANGIFIYDPIFGINDTRVREMCDVLKGRRFTYMLESRVDVLRPEHIPSLRDAGVVAIYLGTESASPATLLRMGKVKTLSEADAYNRKAKDLLRACFEHDVTPMLSYMIGYPGDTEADYMASLTFTQEANQLHNEITARTGVQTGWRTFATLTRVENGTVMRSTIADLPGLALEPTQLIGEDLVVSPSRGVSLEMSKKFQREIFQSCCDTPIARERLFAHLWFPLKEYLSRHPDVIDEDDVIVLDDGIRDFRM
jgi:hypothetical protein